MHREDPVPAAAPPVKSQPRPQQKQTPRPKKNESVPKDNPYLRPFGKLATEELERQITETETALAACQQEMAGTSRNPQRGQKLHNEYKQLSKKLEELEAEYFTRGK